VIEVSVRRDREVEVRRPEREVRAVLRVGVAAALEQAAVNEEAAGVGLDEIGGAGDLAGGAEKRESQGSKSSVVSAHSTAARREDKKRRPGGPSTGRKSAMTSALGGQGPVGDAPDGRNRDACALQVRESD
jgi:hypothetical protein